VKRTVQYYVSYARVRDGWYVAHSTN
jgi:hypothetical protein